MKINPYACAFCQESYSSASKLVIHVKNNHVLVQQADDKNETLKEHRENKVNIQPNNREEQETIQIDEKPFPCNFCEKTYDQSHKRLGHEKTYHKGLEYTPDTNSYTCNTCNKIYSSHDCLQKHLIIHKEKKYSCDFCGSTFFYFGNLKVHRRTHTGEKPFGCKFCNKKFAQQTNKKKHERSHSGEKPYACIFCDKKFNHWSNRMRHEKVHTGVKPFACKYCDKAFLHSSNLKNHEMQRHLVRLTHSQTNETSCEVQGIGKTVEKVKNEPKDDHITDAWKSDHTGMNYK